MKPIAAAVACLTSFAIASPAFAQPQGYKWPCRDAFDFNRVLQGDHSVQNSPLLIRNIRLESDGVFTEVTAKVLNRSKRVVNRACVVLRYERQQNGKSEIIQYTIGLPIGRIAPGKEVSVNWPNSGLDSNHKKISIFVHAIRTF